MHNDSIRANKVIVLVIGRNLQRGAFDKRTKIIGYPVRRQNLLQLGHPIDADIKTGDMLYPEIVHSHLEIAGVATTRIQHADVIKKRGGQIVCVQILCRLPVPVKNRCVFQVILVLLDVDLLCLLLNIAIHKSLHP